MIQSVLLNSRSLNVDKTKPNRPPYTLCKDCATMTASIEEVTSICAREWLPHMVQRIKCRKACRSRSATYSNVIAHIVKELS